MTSPEKHEKSQEQLEIEAKLRAFDLALDAVGREHREEYARLLEPDPSCFDFDSAMQMFRALNGEEPDEQQRSVFRVMALESELRSVGWEPGACAGWDRGKPASGIGSSRTRATRRGLCRLAAATLEVACQRKPDTVRGIMYAMVSLGWIPDTSRSSYNRVQYLLHTMRLPHRILPFEWIVDNIRSTIKPSSWSGLSDYVETVRNAYRRDFWASLPDYVAIVVEKDTVAGRLVNLAYEYDVPMHPLRGFVSDTFGWEVARDFERMGKRIHVYYIGDFDPSGMEIERSCIEKIREITDVSFTWNRLGFLPSHFDEFNVRPLKPKKKDTRTARFVKRYGHWCAEVEAIPAPALRRMVESAILNHIPADEWNRLLEIETQERESFNEVLQVFQGGVA